MPRFSRILPEVVFLAAPLMGGPVVGQERPVVLKATTIVDGRGEVIQNAIIVVEGGKIGRIGGAMPPGAITYDLTGLTVTPGWIDTHDHILWHFHNGRMSSVGVEGLPAISQRALATVVATGEFLGCLFTGLCQGCP